MVTNELVKLDLVLANKTRKLNETFKLPEKFKVTGLTRNLNLNEDSDSDSNTTYDDTNMIAAKNEATSSARSRYRSTYFYIPTKEKTIGTIRPCVHDAISVVLSRFIVLGITEKLYEKIPPFLEIHYCNLKLPVCMYICKVC